MNKILKTLTVLFTVVLLGLILFLRYEDTAAQRAAVTPSVTQ